MKTAYGLPALLPFVSLVAFAQVSPGGASPSPLNNSNPALNGGMPPSTPSTTPLDSPPTPSIDQRDRERPIDSSGVREPSSIPERIERRDPAGASGMSGASGASAGVLDEGGHL